ncbi:SPOR domain-containing protein [Polycyclovorans algicola]|uniref:SPOR domain-containing protein n=1 Tax=Polycyclovorans algicola TaxID=616992 RepID=UPI0004A75510|nr:SPOR domain-containing protein [Polycyclovorans algicola]
MASAYGNRPPNRRPSPARRNDMPGWVWGLVGLTIGLGIAAYVYITRPVDPMPVVATPRTSEPAPDVSPTPSPRQFSFYELLPKQPEVMVDPRPIDRPAADAPVPAPTAASTEYWVQVAAYRNQDDAERQKAALALLGEEALVEKVTIDGRETFYRVRLGPVTGLETAQALSNSVNRNGFDSMVVKVQ